MEALPCNYRFANCLLDVSRRELRCDGALCHVEPQVFDLLALLIENHDRVLSREEIFRAIWGDRIVSDAVLSTRINAARSAIGDSGAVQRLIRTVHRRGFRFVGQVLVDDVRVDQACAASADAPAMGPSPVPRFVFDLPDAPIVLVQPFAGVGDDWVAKRLAEGLTEDLAAALTRLGWLLVTLRYPARDGIDPPAPSEGPAVYALRGSVQHAAGRLRFATRLIDHRRGHHLWAEQHDRTLTGELAIQDDIVRKIVTAVGGQIFAAEKRRARSKSPSSLRAWDCIVRALSLMNTRGKREVSAALALLYRAIAIDPKCAPAYSLLAFVTTMGVHLGWHSATAIKPVALRAARQALALDEEEPWGHVASGYAAIYLDRKPEQAFAPLAHACALNPNLAVAHYLTALALCYAGKAENAFAHADLAERLDPHDLLARGHAGAYDNVRATASFSMGRYADGIAFARKAIASSPAQVPAYRQLVMNSALAGEPREAATALRVVRKLAPRVREWVRENEPLWTDREDFLKYRRAFHIAGL